MEFCTTAQDICPIHTYTVTKEIDLMLVSVLFVYFLCFISSLNLFLVPSQHVYTQVVGVGSVGSVKKQNKTKIILLGS